jgi:hypothetical protein
LCPEKYSSNILKVEVLLWELRTIVLKAKMQHTFSNMKYWKIDIFTLDDSYKYSNVWTEVLWWKLREIFETNQVLLYSFIPLPFIHARWPFGGAARKDATVWPRGARRAWPHRKLPARQWLPIVSYSDHIVCLCCNTPP